MDSGDGIAGGSMDDWMNIEDIEELFGLGVDELVDRELAEVDPKFAVAYRTTERGTAYLAAIDAEIERWDAWSSANVNQYPAGTTFRWSEELQSYVGDKVKLS